MGSNSAPVSAVAVGADCGGGAEVTIVVELGATPDTPAGVRGSALVATPTRVDPLLPTLAVEAEYIMRPSYVILVE